MTPAEAKLFAEYESALKKLQSCPPSSSPLGFRNTIEQEYGQAYRNLVRAGLREPVRKKYRGY